MGDYILPPVLDVPVLKDKSAQVIIDHKRYIVWVFPPKCAQTSLRVWVGDENVASPATFAAARNCINDRKYRLIMSLRHPVSRFLSAHANKFPHLPLEKLVQLASQHTDAALDIHLQSQSYYLDRLGRERPDLVLRVESLREDCEHIGWVEDVPEVRNTSSWSHDEFMALPVYLRELLIYRYSRDLALWESS